MNLCLPRLIPMAVVLAVLTGSGVRSVDASRSNPVYTVETGLVIERHPEKSGLILVVAVEEGIKNVPVSEDEYDRFPPLSHICIRFERGKPRGFPAQPVPLIAVK
jgi:hypothetical protein